MLEFMRTKLSFIVLFIFIFFLPAQSQIRPEISIGGRYIPEYNFFAREMTFPVAIELGGGVVFNNKWYLGTNVFYYGKKYNYDYDGYNYDSDIYQLELEIKKTFRSSLIPKLGIDLSFRPGLMLATLSHDNISYPQGTYFDETKYPISLSTGLSYLLIDNIKLSIWPGVSWFANKDLWFHDLQVNYFCGAGIAYKF